MRAAGSGATMWCAAAIRRRATEPGPAMPRGMAIRRVAVALCVLLGALVLAAAPAQANRTLITKAAVNTTFCRNCPPPPPNSPLVPLPDGQLEGTCGVAVKPGGGVYVSDYYHHAVVFFGSGVQIFAGNPPEGPCGLAIDSGGALYANLWHRSVVRLEPSVQVIDTGESTGVAVDAAGNVYVNDREYVAKYEAPVEPEEAPVAEIGAGSLVDAYGLAVFGGRVYVPDAATNTVKVYEPAVDLDTPVDTISQGFVSLADGAVAVDPSNGHVLVADNTQPGFEFPKAAVYEFDASGAFLGKLPGSPIHGAPTGLAVAADGTLYVTDGNTELANVFKYSPYSASLLGSPAPPGGSSLGDTDTAGGAAHQAASADATGESESSGPGARPRWASRQTRASRPARASRGPTELVQKGPIRVAVSGDLAPRRLPRRGDAPITVSIGGRISSTDPQTPPQLRKVSFAFNRAGQIDTRGLPRCRLSDIDPSSTRQALEACRRSLVGEGRFSANVRLPEQSPFPSAGRVTAFNGILEGQRVVFAHIYGTRPVPTSIVLPLAIREGKGKFGTRLDASMADLTGDWGYVTGIDLTLGRKYAFHGERHSFLSAGCPAPKGFPGALFALAKTSFSFVGGKTLTATLTRSCKVR